MNSIIWGTKFPLNHPIKMLLQTSNYEKTSKGGAKFSEELKSIFRGREIERDRHFGGGDAFYEVHR